MESLQELNEKLVLRSKTAEWKELKMKHDINILAEQLGLSRTAISDAINKGKGSLSLLRAVDKYFGERKSLKASLESK
jgi:predicted DNA-binding protein YlxM (UPF0122 family)